MSKGWAYGAAVAAGLSVAFASVAEEAPSAVFDLGLVEIIGTQDSAQAPMASETVGAETLHALHRTDLGEAVELLPGVALQNVGQRRERLVSVRGFNSRQVPLFIDGVPVYVPYDGNVDLARFGVDYVSQVTVSKGLASVLYGPNILGGAINVVSRRPVAPLEASVSLGVEDGESHDSLQTRITGSVGALRGHWYGHATASYVDAEGYSLPDDFEPTATEDGGARENAESRDTVLSAKLGYLTTAGDEYALSLYHQEGDKNSPPYAGSAAGVQARYWQWPYWDKQSLYFTARNGIADQGTLRWRVYYDRFKNSLNSYDDATYSSFDRGYAFEGSDYDDDTFGGNADLEWRWVATQATRMALHWKQDVHREVDEVGAPEERYEDRSYALAIEHEWRPIDGLTLTPGYAYTVQEGREAENNVDGELEPFPTGRADAHNVQLTALWGLSPTSSLLAGVSRKTRFPTIKDRYSFRLGSAVPNPALDPETAIHYEVGIEQRHGRLEWRAAVFQADLDDAIENVVVDSSQCSAPNPNCFQQRNVGEQRNRGIELSLGWQPMSSLRLDAQASYLDRDNLSSPDVHPTDTPEQKYRLSAQWRPIARLTLRPEVQHQSRRYSTSDGSRTTDAFTVVNLFSRYEPMPSVGLELGIRNLGDALYAYQEGFYEAGRSWLAEVDYRF